MVGFLVRRIGQRAREEKITASGKAGRSSKKRQGGILLTHRKGVNAMRTIEGLSRENTDG